LRRREGVLDFGLLRADLLLADRRRFPPRSCLLTVAQPICAARREEWPRLLADASM
jgi:hypothetical protein